MIDNINDYYFISICNCDAFFYEKENYNLFKEIHLGFNIKEIKRIKEKELLILIGEGQLLFINTKYLELVQKFEYKNTETNFISNDFNFLIFILDNNKKYLEIKKYDIENGKFYDNGKMKTKQNYNIFLTNNYLYLIKGYKGNNIAIYSLK